MSLRSAGIGKPRKNRVLRSGKGLLKQGVWRGGNTAGELRQPVASTLAEHAAVSDKPRLRNASLGVDMMNHLCANPAGTTMRGPVGA